MKKFLALLSLSLMLLVSGCGGASSKDTASAPAAKKESTTVTTPNPTGNLPSLKGKKVLVAYFSWGGNTQKLAQAIHQKTGGELFEIQVENPYPKEYQATVDQAKKEQADNVRPALKNKVANFAQYDVIFLGFPNWWSTTPMPVLTFMESYDWKGKTVVPFFTHGGGGVQSCNDAVVKNLSGAKVLPYLCISGGSVGSSSAEMDKWLNDLKF